MKPFYSPRRQAHGHDAKAAVVLPARSLAAELRNTTRALHNGAERSGIYAHILSGKASRQTYVLLLRNLLPVYRSLEEGLDHHCNAPGVRLAARPTLYRSAAIAHDLSALDAASDQLPLLPAAVLYARRIEEISAAEPCRLIGHAYVRYFGDLSGGQVVRRFLAPRVPPMALTFFDFSEIPDLSGYKAEYRRALSQAAYEADSEAIIDEAKQAFRLTIALSCAVETATTEFEQTQDGSSSGETRVSSQTDDPVFDEVRFQRWNVDGRSK
ncbi:MAG: biliverdin-producing heme oxygenase [Xanthobacteraceae bacterium]